ncbi:hypothetical protein [Cryptosporangium aurantiacum]|uniref:Excreted virulence factor EspC, type VII ESX diderm n=1 Tax=Cryptosporangium aurantiacum TaxID=134849 RepID=A0A1M7NR44_9ACTN|nr:hypothetical protein [Cryptosporangium aurantiacum]SHN06298.1 hypothetical protein SAMN05443668_102789 [Cryptosporangium aurantiacum]
MSFSVHPAALNAYADQLRRARDDAGLTKSYLDRYRVQGKADDGLYLKLLGNSHEQAMGAALTTIGTLVEVLNGSQYNMAAASSYYRAADAHSAARIDATLPGVRPTRPTSIERDWRNDPCAPSFRENREPADRLVPVEAPDYDHPFSFLDYLSVSEWTLKAFEVAIGLNPLDYLTEKLAGDWEAFGKAGKALGNSANAVHDVAHNVQGGDIALRSFWTGNAASAADRYFTMLATKSDDIVDPLREASKEYDSLAVGIWNASQYLSGTVKNMVDNAIIAGIAFAAGTITIESGIGPIIGYSGGAFALAMIIIEWNAALEVVTDIYNRVQLCIGVIQSAGAKLYNARFPDIGTDAYHHPLADRPAEVR